MMPPARLANTILALPRSAKRVIAVCVDVCLCILTAWIAICFRYEMWVSLQGNQWLAVLAAPLLAIPLFFVFGLYRAIFRFAGTEALAAVARSVGIYALVYSVTFTAVGFKDVPRTIGLLQPLLLLLSVGAARLLARKLLGESYSSALNAIGAINVLIYGAGDSGAALAASLAKNQEMRVVGFLDDNPSLHRGLLMGVDVYNPKDVASLVYRFDVSDVLLAMPSISRARRNDILKTLSSVKVTIRTLPTLSDLALGRVQTNDLRELDIEDLLGRDAVLPDATLLAKNILKKTVLVTGAGGSIGSELCRQIARIGPTTLVLLELNEFALYTIQEELLAMQCETGGAATEIVAILASVQDQPRLMQIFDQWRPHTIYHAAAYKHVPLVEDNPVIGIQNNVFGTLNVTQAALACDANDMVLISTDKAVRPTNVMGATKRMAELVMQALAHEARASGQTTRLSIVRFGNVLGSSGSVVPKFRQQIREGGPITLTHRDITRYFMTIPEAAQLVIQAGGLARSDATDAEIFLLDMGEPVKIFDLARMMIELSGLTLISLDNPHGDIAIATTGLRPGEKLYEELLIDHNAQPTKHIKIMQAIEAFIPLNSLNEHLNNLRLLSTDSDVISVRQAIQKLVPEYQPTA
jgi:FlaA1/EpsC-like NDP-sugar epimerase